MEYVSELLKNNREWVSERLAQNKHYFEELAKGQQPKILWIGCSDSRVSPDEITKSHAGDMFVHRNIANLVVQTDMNLLSVIQYAVEVLKVQHIIVCGHYGCGGVKTAMSDASLGLIDNWVRQIKDTQNFYWRELGALEEPMRFRQLVELNVVEQVYNIGKTNFVQQAWAKGAHLYLHGWVFELETGLLHPQNEPIRDHRGIDGICKFAQGIIGR
jgi:carbonic anhydrase